MQPSGSGLTGEAISLVGPCRLRGYMFGFLKARKRRRLWAAQWPPVWTGILERNFSLYRRIPEADQRVLHGHILVFLAEKRFEGCGGLVVTDEIRVTVAAQACLLILRDPRDYYPSLNSILVYPSAYVADVVDVEPGGVITEGWEDRSGETWEHGSLVLSWDDTLGGGGTLDGYNVVLHEFAHLLDLENGAIDGVPRLPEKGRYREWVRVFTEAFESFAKEVERGRKTLLDPYGTEGPAEFFAVATETFFERPVALKRAYPALYEQLATYYGQDPACW